MVHNIAMDEVLWSCVSRHHIRYKTTCGKKLQISKMLVYSAVLSGGFLNLEYPWAIQKQDTATLCKHPTSDQRNQSESLLTAVFR